MRRASFVLSFLLTSVCPLLVYVGCGSDDVAVIRDNADAESTGNDATSVTSDGSALNPCAGDASCTCNFEAYEIDSTRTCIVGQAIAQGLCVVAKPVQELSDITFCAVDSQGTMFMSLMPANYSLSGTGWTGQGSENKSVSLPPMKEADRIACITLTTEWVGDSQNKIPLCGASDAAAE